MRKSIIAESLLAAVIVMSLPKVVAAAEPLSVADFGIQTIQAGGVIRLEDSTSKVLSELGDPLKQSAEQSQPPNDGPLDRIIYEYAGLEIGFLRDIQKVAWMTIRSADYITRRGLRIGDKEGQVIGKYGQPDSSEGTTAYMLRLKSEKSPSGFKLYLISFVTKDGSVAEIWLGASGE
jgi:hypothetical protein